MSFVKTLAAVSVMAFCYNVMAATDIYTGKVNFTGIVENAACAISAGDVNGQTVNLGNVRLAEISGSAGKASAAKTSFTITLEDCSSVVSSRAAIKFTGNTAPNMDNILVGTGIGVGIQIFDNVSAAPLVFGTNSSAYELSNGQNTLDFKAGFASTTATPEAGAVTATANFQVNYL
ncbi:type 1 fimbrial protein [Salmonella enterica]|uniref:fimbrial protein n=1 Tax=Citrobacter sp. wls710 TaxID=2576426 RepID=UPI0010C93657|nr:fimbrial protein [Citrobacter sp. wls710]EBK0028752.1 type 1 fimbrial protein [Salmonella enterica]EDN6746558.1 type 1 fimbrial protein [Salmonella enterica]ELI0025941.1 type 1 fimbrial protein [Salmonella enterica]ELI0151738.1 type 1 fimbrial protein [Salmonella enterica]TKU73349.1 type 1 fimbrial protein [Citrobacter sp. wls710]